MSTDSGSTTPSTAKEPSTASETSTDGPAAGPRANERLAAIADFAAALREVRATARTPSFRAMAATSAAISHTTLHEAAQGHRLPSWETTVEFVRACGADPSDFRRRWDDAAATVATARDHGPAADRTPVTSATSAVSTPATTSPSRPLDPAIGLGGPKVASRRSMRRPWQAAGVVLAAVLATAGVVGALTGGTSRKDGVTPDAPPDGVARAFDPDSPGAAGCPVQQQNPPPAGPATAGDRPVFVADVTLSDCTEVARGTRVTKTWRLKNAGTVPWRRYTLHRLDPPTGADDCQTIPDIPVPPTAPGQEVEIQVEVITPRDARFCFVPFKLLDDRGRIASPGTRPVNFQIFVR
jgi:hypothetical protein